MRVRAPRWAQALVLARGAVGVAARDGEARAQLENSLALSDAPAVERVKALPAARSVLRVPEQAARAAAPRAVAAVRAAAVRAAAAPAADCWARRGLAAEREDLEPRERPARAPVALRAVRAPVRTMKARRPVGVQGERSSKERDIIRDRWLRERHPFGAITAIHRRCGRERNAGRRHSRRRSGSGRSTFRARRPCQRDSRRRLDTAAHTCPRRSSRAPCSKTRWRNRH